MRSIMFLGMILLGLSSEAQPLDKQYHLAGGIIMGGSAAMLSHKPVLAAITISTLAGIGAEIHDVVGHDGVFDKRDLAMTVIGGVVSGIVVKMVRHRIHKLKRKRR